MASIESFQGRYGLVLRLFKGNDEVGPQHPRKAAGNEGRITAITALGSHRIVVADDFSPARRASIALQPGRFLIAPFVAGLFGLPLSLSGRIGFSRQLFLFRVQPFEYGDIEFRTAVVTGDGLRLGLKLNRRPAVRAFITD